VHASLGVNARSVTDGTRDGALVVNVEPGSAAAAAGILEQDVVIAVDGKPVGSSEELSWRWTPTSPERRSASS
jgi:S1-C subfamily serine protease